MTETVTHIRPETPVKSLNINRFPPLIQFKEPSIAVQKVEQGAAMFIALASAVDRNLHDPKPISRKKFLKGALITAAASLVACAPNEPQKTLAPSFIYKEGPDQGKFIFKNLDTFMYETIGKLIISTPQGILKQVPGVEVIPSIGQPRITVNQDSEGWKKFKKDWLDQHDVNFTENTKGDTEVVRNSKRMQYLVHLVTKMMENGNFPPFTETGQLVNSNTTNIKITTIEERNANKEKKAIPNKYLAVTETEFKDIKYNEDPFTGYTRSENGDYIVSVIHTISLNEQYFPPYLNSIQNRNISLYPTAALMVHEVQHAKLEELLMKHFLTEFVTRESKLPSNRMMIDLYDYLHLRQTIKNQHEAIAFWLSYSLDYAVNTAVSSAYGIDTLYPLSEEQQKMIKTMLSIEGSQPWLNQKWIDTVANIQK